ncbi:MAG: hypothetical protein BGP13_14370 [Sphingobacteriales bacterium 40-81]|nr:MAG: hypothetical protein BGP13_14370 [Sphingobacteriales bacterium 40-81]
MRNIPIKKIIMEQKKDIIKKLERVGQLSKIISCVATALIVVIYLYGSSDDAGGFFIDHGKMSKIK